MMSKIVLSDLDEVYHRSIPWDLLEGKTVLITGAYGMLASYVTYMLIYLNEYQGMHIQMIVLVRSLEKCLKRFSGYTDKKYFHIMTDSLYTELNWAGDIHYMIHAASLASPQYYKVCPIDVLLPNTLGTYHLLQLAVEKKVRGYLLFSSAEIYGAVRNEGGITENTYGPLDPLDIHNCYSESKRMAETMCKAFHHQKGIPVKIVRIWHTYAPTMDIDSDKRVFSSFVHDMVNHHDIRMKSDGSAKRSFCYIADAVAAFFLVLLKGTAGEAYNVCNPESFHSIAELAEILKDISPWPDCKIVREPGPDSNSAVVNASANDILPDSGKLEDLGWKTKYDVRAGFRRVLDALAE